MWFLNSTKSKKELELGRKYIEKHKTSVRTKPEIDGRLKRIPLKVKINGDPNGNKGKDNNYICSFCGEKIRKNEIPYTEGVPFPYFIRLYIDGIGWKLYYVHTSCYLDMYNIFKDIISQNSNEFILESL